MQLGILFSYLNKRLTLRTQIPVQIRKPSTAADASIRAIVLDGVFTRSSKRGGIRVYFEYICWKFAGRLLDRVNTPMTQGSY